jgi:hypothetical protein
VLHVHDNMPLISQVPVVQVAGEAQHHDKDQIPSPMLGDQPTRQPVTQEQQPAAAAPPLSTRQVTSGHQLPSQPGPGAASENPSRLAPTGGSASFQSLRASMSAGRRSNTSIPRTVPALPPSWPLVSTFHLQQQQQYQLPPRARRGTSRQSGEYTRSAVQDLELVVLPPGDQQRSTEVQAITTDQGQVGTTQQHRGPTWRVYVGGLWYETGPGVVQRHSAAVTYRLPFQAVVVQPDLTEVCCGVTADGEPDMDKPSASSPSSPPVADDGERPAADQAGPSSPRHPNSSSAEPLSPSSGTSGRSGRLRTSGCAGLHSSRGSRRGGAALPSGASFPDAGGPPPPPSAPPQPGPASLMPHAVPDVEVDQSSRRVP